MTWRDFQRQQRVTEVRDTFISYLDEGQGEPVVLLHGIPTWSYLWTPVLGTLTRAARVLAPDLAGFGFSDKRDCFDRSIARQAELVDAWMDRLGISSAVIVGHDIGGGVALRLATLFPSRVRKLCVMNTVCYDSWPIELMLQFGHPGADRLLSAAMAMRLLRQALKGGFARRPPAALLDGLLAPYSTEVGKLSLIRNASALNTNLTTEIVPRLRSIDVPTLILWGEDDVFQPVSYGERLSWDIPGAHFVRIGGARHFLMVDRPHAVARRLNAFISS
ncbi:MAG: alpha/beta hydrolase [Acidobacteria bacterium]|nr:alpha/beta hydrolase [Acidobacteriota bacterium]